MNIKHEREVILNADQLRKWTGDSGPLKGRGIGDRNEIYIILDNVLDTYNMLKLNYEIKSI